MGFIIEEDCKPNVAEKDIVCYKALFKTNDGRYYSMLQYYYEIGKLYFVSSKDFNCSHKRGYEIGKGFHSFINKPDPSDYSQLRAGEFGDVLLKCVIPKGAIYFRNNVENHCISNAIRLVKEIKPIKSRWSYFFLIHESSR